MGARETGCVTVALVIAAFAVGLAIILSASGVWNGTHP